MPVHHLQLATEPFEAIKNGNKTIESRLYDEKRQAIELGDELVFTNREHTDQTITVKVVGLLRYKSFKDLFTRNDPAKFGSASSQRLLHQIRAFYTIGAEQKYGVIGIEIELA